MTTKAFVAELQNCFILQLSHFAVGLLACVGLHVFRHWRFLLAYTWLPIILDAWLVRPNW